MTDEMTREEFEDAIRWAERSPTSSVRVRAKRQLAFLRIQIHDAALRARAEAAEKELAEAAEKELRFASDAAPQQD